eukprot:GHVU01105311.1.p2 GENE.GHVU01105311.1~~GHVU01105311.1.p2  ORF type:complete len:187 (+),score=42.94 GHVU01105311.1:860-1420(+)
MPRSGGNKPKKRVVDATEMTRRTQGNRVAQQVQQQRDEDCCVVASETGADNLAAAGDDDPDVVEVPYLNTDEWYSWELTEEEGREEGGEEPVEEQYDEDEEQEEATMRTEALAGDVAAFEHSTGAEHRQLYPLPEGDKDIKKFPQEKRPPGARGWKLPLSELFPPRSEAQHEAVQFEPLPSCLLPS